MIVKMVLPIQLKGVHYNKWYKSSESGKSEKSVKPREVFVTSASICFILLLIV